MAVRDIVSQLGSQGALAGVAGVSQQAVSAWQRKDKPLPPEHVLAVEAATGISRHDLRPDIYPREAADAFPGGVAGADAGGASTPARADAVPEPLSGLTA